MIRIALICALSALVGCGADGDPVPYEGAARVSGDARIGVVGGL